MIRALRVPSSSARGAFLRRRATFSTQRQEQNLQHRRTTLLSSSSLLRRKFPCTGNAALRVTHPFRQRPCREYSSTSVVALSVEDDAPDGSSCTSVSLVQQHIRNGDLRQAQEAWKQLVRQDGLEEESTVALASELFVAWQTHHANVLASLEDDTDSFFVSPALTSEKKEVSANSTSTSSSSSSSSSFQYPLLLDDLHQAAHSAHFLLDQLHPHLSPRRDPTATAPNVTVESLNRAATVLQLWATTLAAVRSHVPRREHYQFFKERPSWLGLPQRAQFLWQQHLQSQNNNATTTTTIQMTNYLLQTWAYSREHASGTRAQSVWDQYVRGVGKPLENMNKDQRPNAETYRLLLRAWAWSGERRAAPQATHYLKCMLERLTARVVEGSSSDLEGDMEPRLEDYQYVLRAWTRSKDWDAHEKAFNVVKAFDECLERGLTGVQLDTACYRYLLLTASKRPQTPNLGEAFVDPLLRRMSNWFLVPDAPTLGAAIQTWRNDVYHSDSTPHIRTRGAVRVQELLLDMHVAHNQSTTRSVRPTTRICNTVLETWAAAPVNDDWLEPAEQLLEQMETDPSFARAKPTVETYVYMLRLLRDSNVPNPTSRARAVLDRFLTRHGKLMATQEQINRPRHHRILPHYQQRPNKPIQVLNAFIDVCAADTVASDGEGRQRLESILQTALHDFRGHHHDAATFVALLRATQNLIVQESARYVVAGQILALAAKYGRVNDQVLQTFRSTVSDDHYWEAVTITTTSGMVPDAWTRHNGDSRALTTDGEWVVPVEALKRRRDGLQALGGGRLPKPPKFGTVHFSDHQ